MRWIWIDRILALEKGRQCVALKNISLAEDVLHDHFPATADRPPTPVMPNTLIVEGMAQTAGILVGHANSFKEKVILAKIAKARFSAVASAGYALRFTAQLDRIDANGAVTTGQVELLDPVDASVQPLAEIQLVFSHVDQNISGIQFPEHNFVFTTQFMDLLRRSGFHDDQRVDVIDR